MSRSRLARPGALGVKIRHADQRAVAERRERIEHVVGRDRATAALPANRFASAMQRGMSWSLVRARARTGRSRAARHRDADVGEPLGDVLLLGRRQAGDLGHVPHRDAAAELALLRDVGDEHAVDGLPGRGPNRCACRSSMSYSRASSNTRSIWPGWSGSSFGAAPLVRRAASSSACDQRRVGLATLVRPSCGNAQFSRSTAPGDSFCERLQRLDALGADRRVDLGMGADAVVPCSMQFSSVSMARVVDVLDREGRFHRLHALHVGRARCGSAPASSGR